MFSVGYKTGRLHKGAGCLSSYPVDPPDPSVNNTIPSALIINDIFNISAEQRREQALRKITDSVNSLTPDFSLRLFVLRDCTFLRCDLVPDGL